MTTEPVDRVRSHPAVPGQPDRRPGIRWQPARWVWVCLGLLSVAVGGVGVVVPGLPTTVFFIAAAACFTRSSPRLERWVLGLSGIGPMVRDHRAGLGMPRRAKVAAIAGIALPAGFAATVALRSPILQIAVVVAAAVGILVVLRWVPTRETVLQRRAGSDPPRGG